MAKTLQHRRGTTTELASVTGAEGEIFMDTTKKTLVVMDGITAGGKPLALEGTGGGGSGSSYDQSLNTTDDVVFNSALVGDVSIIGNTISGVDSYGLPSILNVEGELTINGVPVTTGGSSTALTGESLVISGDTTYTDTSHFNHDTINYDYTRIALYPWDFSISFNGVNSNLSPLRAKITNALVGKRINFSFYYNGSQNFVSNVLVTGVYDFGSQIVINLSSNDNIGTFTGNGYTDVSIASLINIFYASYYTYSYDSNTSNGYLDLVYSVTTGGPWESLTSDINGTMVNGDLIADSIIATNALIGDVSIIGNNIATLDSYGNPGALNISATDIVFDSDVNLSVDTRASTTETVQGGMSSFQISSMGTALFKYNSGNSNWVDYTKFVIGSVVTLTSSMYGTYVIQLTSNMSYDMANGWHATFTSISGNYGGGVGPFSAATVVNSTGSVANYSFDDQGVLTAPTVSTTELLINGTAPSFLTDNIDGSKSVVVDTLNTTVDTVSVDNTSNFQLSGSYFRLNNGSSPWADSSKFVTGSIVTLSSSMYGHFVVELTSDMTYDMTYGWRATYTAITGSPSISEGPFYSVTVSNTTGSVADYGFNDQGVLTVPSLIATDALIGDVSIVGNTIAGVDSYGLANKLIIDGDLEVTGELSSPSALSLTVGGELVVYDINTYMGANNTNWNGTSFEFPNDDSALNAILTAMPIGSHIKFTHYMYGAFDLVTTSTATNTGTSLQFNVNTSSPYGMGVNLNPNDVQLVYPGPIASYGFGTDGALVLPDNVSTPVDNTTIVKWVKLSIGGQVYFTPLYQ